MIELSITIGKENIMNTAQVYDYQAILGGVAIYQCL